MAKEPAERSEAENETSAEDRMTDGSTMAIGGVVNWAGEGDHRKEGDRIGPPQPTSNEDEPDSRKARLRDAAASLPEPDFDADDDPFGDEDDDDDKPEETEDT